MIPASVEVIENSAFLGCNQSNISFEQESNLQKIGEKAIMVGSSTLRNAKGAMPICHRQAYIVREISFEEGKEEEELPEDEYHEEERVAIDVDADDQLI